LTGRWQATTQRGAALHASAEQRRRHAQEVQDLKAAAAVYANQVQVLALRNAELEADNRRLVAQLAQVEAAVIPMADRT
jgi:hypothetical protein